MVAVSTSCTWNITDVMAFYCCAHQQQYAPFAAFPFITENLNAMDVTVHCEWNESTITPATITNKHDKDFKIQNSI